MSSEKIQDLIIPQQARMEDGAILQAYLQCYDQNPDRKAAKEYLSGLNSTQKAAMAYILYANHKTIPKETNFAFANITFTTEDLYELALLGLPNFKGFEASSLELPENSFIDNQLQIKPDRFQEFAVFMAEMTGKTPEKATNEALSAANSDTPRNKTRGDNTIFDLLVASIWIKGFEDLLDTTQILGATNLSVNAMHNVEEALYILNGPAPEKFLLTINTSVKNLFRYAVRSLSRDALDRMEDADLQKFLGFIDEFGLQGVIREIYQTIDIPTGILKHQDEKLAKLFDKSGFLTPEMEDEYAKAYEDWHKFSKSEKEAFLRMHVATLCKMFDIQQPPSVIFTSLDSHTQADHTREIVKIPGGERMLAAIRFDLDKPGFQFFERSLESACHEIGHDIEDLVAAKLGTKKTEDTTKIASALADTFNAGQSIKLGDPLYKFALLMSYGKSVDIYIPLEEDYNAYVNQLSERHCVQFGRRSARVFSNMAQIASLKRAPEKMKPMILEALEGLDAHYSDIMSGFDPSDSNATPPEIPPHWNNYLAKARKLQRLVGAIDTTAKITDSSWHDCVELVRDMFALTNIVMDKNEEAAKGTEKKPFQSIDIRNSYARLQTVLNTLEHVHGTDTKGEARLLSSLTRRPGRHAP